MKERGRGEGEGEGCTVVAVIPRSSLSLSSLSLSLSLFLGSRPQKAIPENLLLALPRPRPAGLSALSPPPPTGGGGYFNIRFGTGGRLYDEFADREEKEKKSETGRQIRYLVHWRHRLLT